jgi:hypothetical protein
MKKLLVQYIVMASVAILCLPAHAQQVAVEGRRQALKEPLRILQLAQGDAVVFPPVFGDSLLSPCSRSSLGRGESYWAAAESDIRRAEEVFAEYMKTQAPADELIQGWPDLRQYHRQAVGVVRAGRKGIYSSFLPADRSSEQDWRQRPFRMCDGGPSFFGVEVDLDSGTVLHVAFDGCSCTIVPTKATAGKRESLPRPDPR